MCSVAIQCGSTLDYVLHSNVWQPIEITGAYFNFKLFQPLVPNTVDEENQTDDQNEVFSVSSVGHQIGVGHQGSSGDLTDNDNNNSPQSPRNQQTEISYRVTPNGLVAEEQKSPPKKKRRIYMIVSSDEPPKQGSRDEDGRGRLGSLNRVTEVAHESKSAENGLSNVENIKFQKKNRRENDLQNSPKLNSPEKNSPEKNSPEQNSLDKNVQTSEPQTSTKSRLFSILDFPKPNL